MAILTTELAMNIFGDHATSRIDRVILWGQGKAQQVPPYFLLAKYLDSRTSEEKLVPDFRHTLAFAVILARAGKLRDRVCIYLDYALAKKNRDGGWPVGKGRTISEVFTLLYGIEFLSICLLQPKLSEETRARALSRRNEAVNCLLSKRSGKTGLWESGVLHMYPWDDVVSTAWVLHRLVPIEGIKATSWDESLSDAAFRIITKASNHSTWLGSSALQRFMVEARVAAAVNRMVETGRFRGDFIDLGRAFLNDWRRRARVFTAKIPDKDLDVSTVTFVLEGLYKTRKLREFVGKMKPTRQ